MSLFCLLRFHFSLIVNSSWIKLTCLEDLTTIITCLNWTMICSQDWPQQLQSCCCLCTVQETRRPSECFHCDPSIFILSHPYCYDWDKFHYYEVLQLHHLAFSKWFVWHSLHVEAFQFFHISSWACQVVPRICPRITTLMFQIMLFSILLYKNFVLSVNLYPAQAV